MSARIPMFRNYWLVRRRLSLRFATVGVMTIMTCLAGCSAMSHVVNNPPGTQPGFTPQAVGVNIHFTDPLSGEMKMMTDAGFKWIRTDIYWASTEPAKGVYDFSAYERLLTALSNSNVRALLIFDYANPLYDNGQFPSTDEGRKAFAAWAKAAVLHFAGHGIVWELYNEPDGSNPPITADQYAKLATTVAETLHTAAPNEIQVGPALSYLMNFSYLETAFKAGVLNYWSGVTVHPYRQVDPETVVSDYNTLHELIAKYTPAGKNVTLLCGEWGYSTFWDGFDDTRQAKYLPREWMINLANNVPITIWYDWRDDPPVPNSPEESHFGVVLEPYDAGANQVFTPKPAYYAAKTVNVFLDGYSFSKRIDVGDDNDYVFLFQNSDATGSGQFRWTAWTTGSPHDVVIPLSVGNYDVTSYLGDTLPSLSASSSGLTIKLNDSPQYLVVSLAASGTKEATRRHYSYAMRLAGLVW